MPNDAFAVCRVTATLPSGASSKAGFGGLNGSLLYGSAFRSSSTVRLKFQCLHPKRTVLAGAVPLFVNAHQPPSNPSLQPLQC
jgi:hypothetical protein